MSNDNNPPLHRTAERICNSALALLDENRPSLSGLSLREVAKRAGITPPAFYRHFPSLEALGVVLVRNATTPLREMLRERRQNSADGEFFHVSLNAIMDFCIEHRRIVRFVLRERAGSSQIIRTGIREQINTLVHDLADDVAERKLLGSASKDDILAMTESVAAIILGAAADFIDIDSDDTDAITQRRANVIRRVEYLVAAYRVE